MFNYCGTLYIAGADTSALISQYVDVGSKLYTDTAARKMIAKGLSKLRSLLFFVIFYIENAIWLSI